jgi:serine/threonine protein kinase/Tfp pilus assembly protein PilF
MNDEQEHPIEALFHTARELNPEERLRFLDEKCGRDSSSRRTIETLLREDATPRGPLDGAVTDSLATTLSPGMVIGPYEVVSVAGIGGMGQVYHAVDRRLKRDVAIKALPVEFTHDRERMERLRGEATVLASLNHANIAGIYDVIEKEGEPPCLVLEFVPGATLAELLRKGPLDIDSTLRISHQIATALEAAHDKGIVHRDLKPSNIKLTPDAKVKVLDFGLARVFTDSRTWAHSGPDKAAESAASTSGLAGTPSYMSPEQAKGRPVDQRADIWSFGCIVYELLTGQKALGEKISHETLSSVPESEPDWTLFPSDTPPELRLLLRQCLEKDLAKRPRDGSNLRRAIEELQNNQHEPLSQSISAPAAILPRGAGRRRRWKAAAVLVLVLAAAAGGTGWWWSLPRVRGSRPSQVAEANRYLAMAMDAGNSGQFERGKELILKALQLDPKFAAAREMYGFILWGEIDGGYSNNPELLYQAESHLQQALADDNESADAHAHLAFVYYYLGRKNKLREEAELSLKLEPANREAQMGMALYHQLNGNYDEAQRILLEIMDSDPGFMPARGNFAENLREMGDYGGAIREYRKLYEEAPQLLQSRAFLAQAYQSDGKLSESRSLLDQVGLADRKNYYFRLVWALQLALENRHDEALREMDGDLQKYAALVYYSLYAAEFYAVLGETDKALDWLHRGIQAGDERAEWFERDPHLKHIWNEPRFKMIVEPIRERRRSAP